MKRESINPWDWGLKWSMDQGDIDGFLANYDVHANWIAEAGTRPPQSLIGVQRLFLPEPTVEIEAVAAE